MKALIIAAASAAIALSVTAGAVAAPDQRVDRGGQHRGWGENRPADHHWRRGERMGYNNWRGARAVDYRRYNLRRPPRGYEWRYSNGQYVLAAITTGLIASIVLNGGR